MLRAARLVSVLARFRAPVNSTGRHSIIGDLTPTKAYNMSVNAERALYTGYYLSLPSRKCTFPHHSFSFHIVIFIDLICLWVSCWCMLFPINTDKKPTKCRS